MGNQLVWHITRQNENIQWRERGGTLLGRLLGNGTRTGRQNERMLFQRYPALTAGTYRV